jgi:hypothetical protein
MTEDVYRDMYTGAVQAIQDHLFKRSQSAGLLYTTELIPERAPDGGM